MVPPAGGGAGGRAAATGGRAAGGTIRTPTATFSTHMAHLHSCRVAQGREPVLAPPVTDYSAPPSSKPRMGSVGAKVNARDVTYAFSLPDWLNRGEVVGQGEADRRRDSYVLEQAVRPVLDRRPYRVQRWWADRYLEANIADAESLRFTDALRTDRRRQAIHRLVCVIMETYSEEDILEFCQVNRMVTQGQKPSLADLEQCLRAEFREMLEAVNEWVQKMLKKNKLDEWYTSAMKVLERRLAWWNAPSNCASVLVMSWDDLATPCPQPPVRPVRDMFKGFKEMSRLIASCCEKGVEAMGEVWLEKIRALAERLRQTSDVAVELFVIFPTLLSVFCNPATLELVHGRYLVRPRGTCCPHQPWNRFGGIGIEQPPSVPREVFDEYALLDDWQERISGSRGQAAAERRLVWMPLNMFGGAHYETMLRAQQHYHMQQKQQKQLKQQQLAAAVRQVVK